ncbi:ribosome small subunit-dependent GTPase A [Brevibacterium daeguense]|uniref:Small ribosomal subunit biogenesis GTPase RsgA n=1 Tax=Brevibacterium daeguense TaxID=909936 RepID=A0ABP8EJC2_9MICO|nr:ribosome small subunit-dependent GTPase A [Brevibacterium daeguense]
MDSRYSDYTEDDYRPRPSRRGSRPRTKRRPDHSDAPIGMVVGVDRGRYRVEMGEPAEAAAGERAIVTCVRASALRRTAIVPGDRVRVIGDTSGGEGTLARLVEVLERTTVLRRSADDTDPSERVIVANADQLVVVTATADPEPSWGLIDRALTAAIDAGITPLLAVTKLDLAPLDDIADRFSATGVEIIPCGFDDTGAPRVSALSSAVAGRLSVLVGPSGVGKSTLMNALVPDAARAIGSVNETTGQGRHTSSSAVCLPLPGGGWIIDTPGVRSFGLAHVDPQNVLAAFAELVPATADCPRGCRHLADSPGCALDGWVASGRAGDSGPARLASLRRLLSNLAS